MDRDVLAVVEPAHGIRHAAAHDHQADVGNFLPDERQHVRHEEEEPVRVGPVSERTHV
jgi:hypothetical protein